ncbi:MFS transporter, partial [Bacillus sp. GMa5/2]
MKNKLLLLSGTGISRLGDFMYLIALNLMVLNSTNSPAAVAGLWIVGPIATVVTKIWSGSIVDRLNKRSIMLITDIIRAALIGCIPLFDSIWAIYMFIFLTRIATSFFDPASFTYKTMLIRAEERAQFNAWNSLCTNGAFIIGPALAGILLTTYSAAFVIYCNSLSFLLSTILIYFLPNITLQTKQNEEVANTFVQTLRSDWKQVFSFARTETYIILIFVLFQATMLVSMALDSQEVVFTRQVLFLTDIEYSMLVSITGAAYVSGSFLVSLFAKRLPIQHCIGLGMIFTAIGYVIFAFSNSFIVAAGGFILLGISSSFAGTGFITFYQNNIPIYMIGRIDSVFDSIKNFIQIFFVLAIGA